MATDEENNPLELAIAQLDREFGAGTVMRLGNAEIAPWPAISTGALSLDLALGIGGLPRGRMVEIYGMESGGKSTLALSVVAEAQKMGLGCAYIDAENALDPGYMTAMGVDLDKLLFSQPSFAEECLTIIDKLVKSEQVGVVVVDSVAAMVPKAELEGDFGQSHMGLQARLMSQALRMLTGSVADTNTLLIWINQLRSKVGVIFGNPEITAGGLALKYYCSVRIDVRKKEDIKDKEGLPIGIRVKAKVPKNKMAPALRLAEFDILYGQGINQLGCVVDLGLDRGIIKKGGSWLSYNDKQLGQGRDRAILALASDLDLADEIRNRICDKE
jgi:recombination protein RecA